MIEQEITVRVGESLFDTKKIKVQVPKGTKLLCTEHYVLDALSMYGLDSHMKDNTKKCDNKESYITKGEVLSIKSKEGRKESLLVDINSKFTAFCSLSKETRNVAEHVKVGMKVDVKVKTAPNGTLLASISDAIDEVKIDSILNEIGNRSVGFNGKVLELTNGGFWVDIDGIQCFMPGSLAGLNKLWDFESVVGKTLVVMPVSYSNERNTIIVSHREYLNTLIPSSIKDLHEKIKNKVSGVVTGATKFGVFAEFNSCLTGLIPDTELDENTLTRLRRREIKPGDLIEFWIKEIISNKKIILSQKGPKEDLWDNIENKYRPMMITPGVVTKVTKYGVFVELEKGISGLIHKSKLNNTLLNKGDNVNVKLLGVNSAERKISMTLVD